MLSVPNATRQQAMTLPVLRSPQAGPGGPSRAQYVLNARPNTSILSDLVHSGALSPPRKLTTSRLPSIVSRMRQETKSSSMKRGRWYKNDSYVDMRSYSWRNLALYTDYQRHMWTKDGAIKSSYRK